MSPEQEPKYMIVDADGKELPDAQIANRATGKPIPRDEPLMIFRGKDRNALHALNPYWSMCENGEHAAAVNNRIGQFYDFKQRNPELVKEPD